jgi:hypothetical protein
MPRFPLFGVAHRITAVDIQVSESAAIRVVLQQS